MDFHVAVQAQSQDRSSWLALAREVERAGFDRLVVPDHPGTTASPFVALAAATAVTERLALGTYVVNAGGWDPMRLATEVATLDVLSHGRAVLGVGAGHTPTEWTMVGQNFPSASERVTRLCDLVTATTALLEAETVSMRNESFHLDDAGLGEIRPVQDRIPLLVGGNGARVLSFAARHADFVGITGAGRTLADGHHHEVDWSAAALRRTVELVAREAEGRGATPKVDALVQHIEITDDAAAAAARLSRHVQGATEDDLLATPHLWLGTVTEIRSALRAHRDELGIACYTIRPNVMDQAREILDGTR